MTLVAKHILVKGDVQGVFFRKNTKDVATDLSLTGWVKNTDKGDVEIFVQGSENKIEELISWCWQGPSKAVVETVEVKEAKPDHQIQEFLVDR